MSYRMPPAPVPEWPCVCGGSWTEHAWNGHRRWRSHPTRVDPFRQWVAEHMPAPDVADNPGGFGFTLSGDDGLWRAYNHRDPIGWVRPVEVKTRLRSEPDVPTRHAFQALAIGHHFGGGVLWMDGDVPTPLHHYPTPCPTCGQPARPMASTRMTFNGRELPRPFHATVRTALVVPLVIHLEAMCR